MRRTSNGATGRSYKYKIVRHFIRLFDLQLPTPCSRRLLDLSNCSESGLRWGYYETSRKAKGRFDTDV
jgi:hypothetical protein